MGCLTSRVTKVHTESLLGKVERPIIDVVSGRGWGCSFIMMGKESVVVADVVEAVSLSDLVRVVLILRIRLCTLNKCEVMWLLTWSIREICRNGCVGPLFCRIAHKFVRMWCSPVFASPQWYIIRTYPELCTGIYQRPVQYHYFTGNHPNLNPKLDQKGATRLWLKSIVCPLCAICAVCADCADCVVCAVCAVCHFLCCLRCLHRLRRHIFKRDGTFLHAKRCVFRSGFFLFPVSIVVQYRTVQ